MSESLSCIIISRLLGQETPCIIKNFKYEFFFIIFIYDIAKPGFFQTAIVPKLMFSTFSYTSILCITGQPVVTASIQQQPVNKPVLINLSSSSRVGNHPGGSIAFPAGHPGGSIALPAGVRLVVPATAGAFSGNLINISSGLYIINIKFKLFFHTLKS